MGGAWQIPGHVRGAAGKNIQSRGRELGEMQAVCFERKKKKMCAMFCIILIDLFFVQAWLTESEEATWVRLAEALEAIDEVQLSNKIREDYCVPEESKNSEQKIVRPLSSSFA